jgi:hypothetical protein
MFSKLPLALFVLSDKTVKVTYIQCVLHSIESESPSASLILQGPLCRAGKALATHLLQLPKANEFIRQ